jgi:citrate lyase subunit beta/citryl-CoA lyase
MSDRSFLFVPGNRPERFDKACASGADAVIIDLEDAVAPAEKDGARESVRRWLSPDKPVYLRLNAADTDWFFADLALVNMAGVRGIALPKAETQGPIGEIHRRSGTATRIIPIIETALGLWKAHEIASAPGVERLAFGSIDFQLDTGISGEHEELLYARSQLVLVSRITGRLAPVDGVTVALDDEALLADDVARARRLGFGGKLCIHPKQVAAINAGFLPPAAEVAWARQVVEAAARASDNAVRLDGKLVDRPVIERARAILAIVDGAKP